MSIDPRGRLERIFARSGVAGVKGAPVMRPAAPKAQEVHQIAKDRLGGFLGSLRQTVGALTTTLTPRWRRAHTGISDPALAAQEALLGRVMCSLLRLEAAERENRGATLSEAELSDFEKAEEISR